MKVPAGAFHVSNGKTYKQAKNISNKNSMEVNVAAIYAVKMNEDETKFEALEEEEADAMEVAAQKDEKREKKKDCKNKVTA